MSKSLTNKKKSKTKKDLDPKSLGRDLTPFEEYRLSLEQDNNVNIGADGMWKNMVEESKIETQANFGKNAGFSQKMGAASSIIGGVGEIAQATAANAKIKDTTEDVNNINQFGNTVYNATDYADAAAQFNNRGELKEYSKNDLTGSAGEKAKNVGKATLSGAKAGAAFGPLGMLIGGAVGAISSGIGAAVGNNKAKKEAERLNHLSMLADLRNTSNFDINTDNIAYQNNMLEIANQAAYGGPLFKEFSNGVTIINEGGTHEENIHGGVPVGVDDKGVPNLVEEDEVIWNNYVFSNRLEPMKSVRTKYKLGGPKDLTFADAAKDISKMSEEMPNDPIVERTKELRLGQLMQEQEVVRMQQNKTNNSIGFAAFGGNIFSGGGNWRNRTSAQGYYDESTGQYSAPATQDALNALYNQWYTEDPEDFTRFRTELAQKEKEARAAKNWKIVNDYIANSGKYHAMNASILGYDASKSHLWGPSTAARLGILNWTPPETVVTPDPEPVVMPEPVVNQEPKGPAVTPEEETSAPGDTSDDDKPKLGLDKILNAANVGFDVVSGYLDRFLTKPDYSHYDSFRDAINRANVRVAADPVVSNLTYKPSDTQSIYNRMQANNAANVRNIMNTSGGNAAIARASLLTNDNNFNNSLSNLWRQVEEGEYARRMNYDKYMTDIAAGNSARDMQADSTNANIASNQAGLWKQYADARQNIDNLTSAALSTNYNTDKQSLQNYAYHLRNEKNVDNAIKNGYIIDNATGRRYIVSAETPATPEPEEKIVTAYGGKIKRTNKKKRRLS